MPMLDLRVIGSAASQPEASKALTSSCSVPIKPTFNGSPGIPWAVLVVLGAFSRGRLVFVVPPKCREDRISQDQPGNDHGNQDIQGSDEEPP